MNTRAIRAYDTGGPEVMKWEEVELGEPGPGQIRVRHAAVGLNYIDTYHRSGLYPIAEERGFGARGAASRIAGERVTGPTSRGHSTRT